MCWAAPRSGGLKFHCGWGEERHILKRGNSSLPARYRLSSARVTAAIDPGLKCAAAMRNQPGHGRRKVSATTLHIAPHNGAEITIAT